MKGIIYEGKTETHVQYEGSMGWPREYYYIAGESIYDIMEKFEGKRIRMTIETLED